MGNGNSKIVLTYKDTKYTLEYTRRTVQIMEGRGFEINDITEQKKIATAIPMLWQGAFLAHHNPVDKTALDPVDKKLADEIYAHVPKKSELIAKLSNMYVEQVTSLLDDPDEDEGNASWEEM